MTGAPAAVRPRTGRRDALLLLAILALAALLRLPGLDARGRWDADQGHDMLVLHALVSDSVVPLLGPLTSIGTFHHGAIYYDLLAPAAFLSGADPVAVTAEIALFGIAAVGAIWWLAGLVGGRAAAHVAGLLAAVSPAGIDESTFIWNPNLIPLAAALAFGGAIAAWQRRRARWWLLAGLGAMVTMQAHVLGAVIVPPLLLAWLADVRRSQAGPERRAVLATGAGALAVVLLGYLPLAVHELQSGGSELRAILAYLAGGGPGSDVSLPARAILVTARAIAWPLSGLITDRPTLSLLAIALALALGVAALRWAPHRGAAAWLVLILGWSAAALAVGAPSLATVTPGLPNDHYHAFLDPVVLVLTGVGMVAVARRVMAAGLATRRATRAAMELGAAIPLLAVLIAIAVPGWPPAVADDGGWRLAQQAAEHVQADLAAAGVTRGRRGRYALVDIPAFKRPDGLGFPLVRLGLLPANQAPLDAAPPASNELLRIPQGVDAIVVVCDPLFADVVGAPCGGPAEDAVIAGPGPWSLADRFSSGTRRVISVYVSVNAERD